MSNEPTTVQTLSPEIVRSKLAIALSKNEQNVQKLHDAEATLVYNEDNLLTIKSFLDECKKANNVVEAEREALKKPYLESGRAVDAGAKLITSEIALVQSKAQSKYNALCQEVERKRKEKEAEETRVRGIKTAMSEFLSHYSTAIAGAKTNEELLAIERLINLETGNSRKYAEFLPELADAAKGIRSLLADQKNKVRQLVELEKKEQEAAEKQDDEAFLEIQDKKEALEASISANSIKIQETFVNAATEASPSGDSGASIILPEIPKGARRQWDYECTDLAALYKKAPELIELSLNKEAVKKIMEEKKEKGELKDREEILLFGGLLRFFVKKSY